MKGLTFWIILAVVLYALFHWKPWLDAWNSRNTVWRVGSTDWWARAMMILAVVALVVIAIKKLNLG